MDSMTYDELKAKGWRQGPDGAWNHPSRGNLDGLGSAEREHDPAPALDGGHAARQSCPEGMVIRVELISLRRRLCDDDNDIAGKKPLRDEIAKTIGLDDGDPAIRWEYAQVLTKGSVGTLVKITLLPTSARGTKER